LAKGTVLYFTAHEANEPKVYQEDLILKELMLDAIAFKATSNLDTLYLQEDMLAPYDAQFQEAMKKVNEHTRKGHCRVIRQSDVPCHSKALLVLWMKCQRRIKMHKVSKPNARLNLWGHKQDIGAHFYLETHAVSIQLMLVLSVIRGQFTRQLDFVMAYPQTDMSADPVYVEIPKGFEFEESRDSCCLHVLKNIYIGQDVGRTWGQ
jgi:Reverse transcriptase (RNA-dependent DNA polymerase)